MDKVHALPAWYAAICGVLGLLLVLAGYRSMRLAARLSAACIFAAIGLLIGIHFNIPALAVGLAAGLGLVGYLLGDAFYYINMALNGAGAGAVLAAAVYAALGRETPHAAAIAGLIAGGFLGVMFERPIGIFGTSVVGGALFAAGLAIGLHGAGQGLPGWRSQP